MCGGLSLPGTYAGTAPCDADRLHRDPDVVAARAAHRGLGRDAAVPARRRHLRHRRHARRCQFHRAARRRESAASAVAGVGARGRRAVRLSRALLHGAAAGAAGGSRADQLSLAAADRFILGAAAGRAVEAASPRRRGARSRWHDRSDIRPRRAWFRAARSAGLCRRLRRGVRLGDLFGGVAALRRRAERCRGRLLSGDGAACRAVSSVVRDDGVAARRGGVGRGDRARYRSGRARVLCLGHRRQARRHSRARRRILRRAGIVDAGVDRRRLRAAALDPVARRRADRLWRPRCGEGYVHASPGVKSGGANSNLSNWNPGATVQPTSVQSPRLSAACHACAGTTACGRWPVARSLPRITARVAPLS